MRSLTYTPSPPLNKYIGSFYFYEGYNPAHRMDRFLPDGNTELIFDLTENTQFIYDNETLEKIQSCNLTWASGIRTRPITIPSGRENKMLIVAFKKGKAYPFYPWPINEITDMVVGSELIFGKAILDLRDQLLSSPSIIQMFLLLEAFLYLQISHSLLSEIESNCVSYTLAGIESMPTRTAFQRITEQIGFSKKHFIKLFKEQVGVPPKQYLKIARFQKAVHEIEKNEPIHWSEIAIQCDFYDQAHFINEFKNYSGFTPSEYLIKKTNFPNYIPIQ